MNKRINFLGFIDGNTGYSVLSRALISLMNRAGLDVRVQDLRGGVPRQFGNLASKDPDNRIQLLHQIPTVMPEADAFYTVTEFDQPPYGSISPMREAEFILTESNFCKEVFEEFVDCPVHVIHYPVDPQFKPNGPTVRLNEEIEKFRFKFLSVFEWIMRKDPYTMIKAFVEEFDKDDDDCCLILRTWSKFENPRKWISRLAPDHNVFWLPQDLPFLAPLYRSCDCFVTSTWGEGFGHPIIEAMACGMGVIAPKSTGILDYANRNNAMLVDVHKEDVGTEARNELDHLIKPWFKCWKPDFEKLKDCMRRAYKNGMKFQRNNAHKIAEKFTIEHSLNQIKEAFDIA